LLIGTNNARHSDASPEQITDGIRAVITHIHAASPSTKVLLLGILPRGHGPEDPTRQRCEAVNSLLPALADGQRVHFINPGTTLLDPSGILHRDLAPDLLHLSVKGYTRIAPPIAEALHRILEK
jgi:beta-glucosidase